MNMPRWKIALILGVCLLGVLLCLPNFFSRDEVAKWPGFVPHRQVSLGLDLQGGGYFLLEVGIKSVIDEQLNSIGESLRGDLRKAQIRFTDLDVKDGAIVIVLREPKDAAAAADILRKLDNNLAVTTEADSSIRATFSEVALRDKQKQIVEQSIEIIRRRIDESGTKELTVQRQGTDRILLQVPGLKDPSEILKYLQVAKLEFHLVNDNVSLAEANLKGVPPTSEIVPNAEKDRYAGAPTHYVLYKRIVVGGDSLTNASPQNDQGRWLVSFRFDSAGGRRFCQATTENVHRQLAIVLDRKVISAPTIQTAICGGSGQITGSYTAQSATDLALLLRAGALPASLNIIEQSTVGPDLGADSIRAGVISIVVAAGLVVIYMVLAYGLFGLFADIALIFNLVITLAIMSLLQATLTLPGIAGLLLTLGMSVDANVLINERIREEVKLGRSPISAIDAGFSRAFSTIFDANVTTLLKMFLLFMLGTGAVKGFAVTIGLGILCSMFTALVLVRMMINLWFRWRRPAALVV
ncbi:MAG: protein translocase subunit SecD [Rhodospirillales bacterium]